MIGWAGRWTCQRRGFTLLELVVVMLIILIVSVAAIAILSPGSWAIRAAARLVQGGLVGARDDAIRKNMPCGVRLARDSSAPVRRLADGQIDPAALLYADRLIPLEPAPD